MAREEVMERSPGGDVNTDLGALGNRLMEEDFRQ